MGFLNNKRRKPNIANQDTKSTPPEIYPDNWSATHKAYNKTCEWLNSKTKVPIIFEEFNPAGNFSEQIEALWIHAVKNGVTVSHEDVEAYAHEVVVKLSQATDSVKQESEDVKPMEAYDVKRKFNIGNTLLYMVYHGLKQRQGDLITWDHVANFLEQQGVKPVNTEE